jgi:hypothetical protein
MITARAAPVLALGEPEPLGNEVLSRICKGLDICEGSHMVNISLINPAIATLTIKFLVRQTLRHLVEETGPIRLSCAQSCLPTTPSRCR